MIVDGWHSTIYWTQPFTPPIMGGMARKKPDSAKGEEPMPPEAPAAKPRSRDRHKARNTISCKPRYYEALKRRAQRNKRPLQWEAEIILVQALIESGDLDVSELDQAGTGDT